jgi:hypothetical protein
MNDVLFEIVAAILNLFVGAVGLLALAAVLFGTVVLVRWAFVVDLCR